jgi:predicted transcriptional regulator
MKMKILEIIDSLNLTLYNDGIALDGPVNGAYVSDLLSDVMGNAEEGQVWITLQSHVNVAAIASLKEMAAVILVKGIGPDEAMLKKATDEGIPVLGTTESTFETAGKIYQILGNR